MSSKYKNKPHDQIELEVSKLASGRSDPQRLKIFVQWLSAKQKRSDCWQIDAFCEVYFTKNKLPSAKAFLQTLSLLFKGHHYFSLQVAQLSHQG